MTLRLTSVPKSRSQLLVFEDPNRCDDVMVALADQIAPALDVRIRYASQTWANIIGLPL